MRSSYWSSDVCSSDLAAACRRGTDRAGRGGIDRPYDGRDALRLDGREFPDEHHGKQGSRFRRFRAACLFWSDAIVLAACCHSAAHAGRSEERRVGKACAVRVDLGGRRIIKKKKTLQVNK